MRCVYCRGPIRRYLIIFMPHPITGGLASHLLCGPWRKHPIRQFRRIRLVAR